MKSYIAILLIALISCSNFLQKSKRIGVINLKNNQYSILTNEVEKWINNFLSFFPEIFKSFLYLVDNSNIDKILSDFKELYSTSENFLKEYSFNNLIERENKISNQVSSIKLNSHTIISYIKDNKFPDEFAKLIKTMIDSTQDKPIFQINLFFRQFEILKPQLSDEQRFDKILDSLKKQVKLLPVLIKNIAVPNIEQFIILYFNTLSKNIEKSMPEVIKNLREIFPKIKSIFHSEKKINEFKKKLRTFFIVKNLASVDDYKILIKSYKIIIEKLFLVFKLDFLYKYSIIQITDLLHDFNIFIHEINESYTFEYFLKLIEKIFINYNIKNLIDDFKNSMNSLKNIVNKIQKDGLGINSLIEKLKEKAEKMDDENIFKICKQLLEYIKMIVNH